MVGDSKHEIRTREELGIQLTSNDVTFIDSVSTSKAFCDIYYTDKEMNTGDMTLQKWMKATMLMAGDRPRTLTIAVPVFTKKMMSAVAKFMQLGWVERLRLLTGLGSLEQVQTQLKTR